MPQVVRVSKEQLGIDAGYVHVNVIHNKEDVWYSISRNRMILKQ